LALIRRDVTWDATVRVGEQTISLRGEVPDAAPA
jgi:hypothetical protein